MAALFLTPHCIYLYAPLVETTIFNYFSYLHFICFHSLKNKIILLSMDFLPYNIGLSFMCPHANNKCSSLGPSL